MSMTTATQRAAGDGQAQQDSPISTSYRKYAGVRTRVLKVDAQSKRRRTSGTRYVMFHGYLDSADTWRRLLLQFAASGDAAIAVDMPGFGQADRLRPGPILPQLDAFVRAVVLEQAKHGDVVLVGNSLGGTVSVRAAQNAKLPIAGLVPIAAPGYSDAWALRAARRNLRVLRVYEALPLPVPDRVVRGVVKAVVPRLMYATAKDRNDADVQRFTDQFPNNRAVRDLITQGRQLSGEIEDCYELDRVTAPLLLLACGKDRLVTVDAARAMHTLVPHSRLVVHEDWGHCPQLDHAAEIHQLVSYFARSTRRAKAVPKQRAAKRKAAG